MAAFVFFYGWDKLDRKTHLTTAWIYAGAAWMSLVLITGITAFMLNSGGWVGGRDGVWKAFWNPQTVPQILARTGTSLLLAALFVFLHAAFTLKRPERLREQVFRRVSQWAMFGGGLVIVGGIGWYFAAPPSAEAALVAAASLNILMTLLFALTGVVIVMLYLGPYSRPGWVTPGFALLLFALGFAATATGEFVREAVRKPFIIDRRRAGQRDSAGGDSGPAREGLLGRRGVDAGLHAGPFPTDLRRDRAHLGAEAAGSRS